MDIATAYKLKSVLLGVALSQGGYASPKRCDVQGPRPAGRFLRQLPHPLGWGFRR
jgi:hypothetical protein